MRYPKLKGAPHQEPAGLRGFAPANTLWVWGLTTPPAWPSCSQAEGDRLAVVMIESEK